MFNIDKQDDVKDKAANLVDSVKANVESVTDKLKYDLHDEAKEVLNMVHV